jgi:drug/metabolite transporter (DMT)-like permease
MQQGTKHMGLAEWAILATLAFVWGSAFFLGKVALNDVGPLTIVLSRTALGALVLNVVVLAGRQQMPRSWAAWGPFALMGVLNNLLPFSLIFWGETQIDSGLAGILNATAPLFSALLAHYASRSETLTPRRLAGVAIGFIGVGIMVGYTALRGLDRNVLAEVAVLVASVCYALAGIYGRRFKDTPPLVAAAGQVTATALMALPVTLLLERPWHYAPSLATWLALLALGVFCTALSYALYFKLLARAGVTNVMLGAYLSPIVASVLGAAVLHEVVAARQIAGMLVIFLGIAILDGRLLSLLTRRRVAPQLPLAPPGPVEPEPDEA